MTRSQSCARRRGSCGRAAFVLAADTDWDTQGFNVADRELGRRVVQAWADGKPDGWAGRRLRGWLTAAGLEPEERCAVVLDATEWGGDTFIAHTWPEYRRAIEKSGRVPAADLERFEAEIDESAANGAFYWSVVRHAWRARVPD